jgi:thiol-disulfide isomerase/thioredoxin
MLVVICSPLAAAIPRFSGHTLDGESISNDSLQGRVVLLQFWTTWCGYCRRDQPIIEELERRFADKGLIILAVNVGEPEEKVRAYLSASPRSCRVVLNSEVDLVSKFGARGFPYYVVLDAQGRVAGKMAGSGGEAALLDMLARAGMTSGTKTSGSDRVRTLRASGGPMIIDVPSGLSTAPLKPRAKTVFVLANGERVESDEYTIDSNGIVVTTDGKKRTIALTELNTIATKAANKERGIDLMIPANRGEIVLSF